MLEARPGLVPAHTVKRIVEMMMAMDTADAAVQRGSANAFADLATLTMLTRTSSRPGS